MNSSGSKKCNQYASWIYRFLIVKTNIGRLPGKNPALVNIRRTVTWLDTFWTALLCVHVPSLS